MRAPSFEVELSPALTAFVLTLVVARGIDERAGVLRKVGLRSLTRLGELQALVPGPGNRVEGATVGDYKRRVVRRLEAAWRAARTTESDVDAPPLFVVHPGYGQGYGLAAAIEVFGVDIQALIERVRAPQASKLPGYLPR